MGIKKKKTKHNSTWEEIGTTISDLDYSYESRSICYAKGSGQNSRLYTKKSIIWKYSFEKSRSIHKDLKKMALFYNVLLRNKSS